jgi:hypothetical protein
MAGTTSRSEKQIEKMRPVSATVRRTAPSLIEGGDARLVHHHVLAATHGLYREPCALVGDRGAADHVDGGIIEEALAGDGHEAGKPLAKAGEHPDVAGLRAEAGARGARVQEAADQMIGMPVIEADEGEADHGDASQGPNQRTGTMVMAGR